MSEHPLTKELGDYGPGMDHLTAALWIARAAPELDRLAEVNAAASAKLKAVERLCEDELARMKEGLEKVRDEMHADGQRAAEPVASNLLLWSGRLSVILASPGPSLQERIDRVCAVIRRTASAALDGE